MPPNDADRQSAPEGDASNKVLVATGSSLLTPQDIIFRSFDNFIVINSITLGLRPANLTDSDSQSWPSRFRLYFAVAAADRKWC